MSTGQLSTCLFVMLVIAFSSIGQADAQAAQKSPAQPATNKPAAAQQPATPKTKATPKPAKAAPPKPLLKPIVHDFTPLLGTSPKSATSAQLKNIVAFVSSDRNITYAATVQTLAPDYAIVTDPVPSDETPLSVMIGAKGDGKRSISVPLATQVTKNLVIPGDFSELASILRSPHCGGVPGCAALLAADGVTVIEHGQVRDLVVSDTQVAVTYTALTTATPSAIRINDASAHYPVLYLAPPKAPLPDQASARRQVIAGDYCQRDADDCCTTEMFKPSEVACKAKQYSERHPVKDQYVLDSGGTEFHQAKLNSLGLETAEISFSAPTAFKPAYLVLVTPNQSYRFPFTPAPPLNTSNLTYTSDGLTAVCDPGDPDCVHTKLKLTSVTANNEVGFVALEGNLIVARVTAPQGQEASAIVVSNVNNAEKHMIARRTVKPGGNSKVLNLNMSIIDQVTAMRNYGNRIAKRYIAVSLDVRNPSSNKVQFNKSAMYFDVDYEESKEKSQGGFLQTLHEVSTLGLYQPSVYKPPFVGLKRNAETPPRVARFGLEQNVQQSPVDYLSVLGSFDYTTAKTDDKLKMFELLGSVLTSIATGGIVADSSGAFKAGTTVFASTFLPGARNIVLDTSFINRLRANLVAQTLQETIQVPAGGSTSTIVLLPRTGILSFTDAEVPVIIKRVIDVHLVEEVVTTVSQTPVKKGECTIGNTKEQIRQALGEPTGVTTNPDRSTSFTYATGAVPSVSFDPTGVVDSCPKPRTPTEQMDLVKTLVEAKQTLTDLGLTATQITLVDGSIVLADIPGISKSYHFDLQGSVALAYTLLFKQISTEAAKANESQDMFAAFLEDKALTADRKKEISDEASANKGKAKPGTSVTYSSPDIQNGKIVVSFKSVGTPAKVVIDKVTFQGDQPKNTN